MNNNTPVWWFIAFRKVLGLIFLKANDISKDKKRSQQIFRELLKRLKFLKLQKSVYLYPYPCKNEIEYLRQYYGIGDEVLLLTVEKIENEIEYKKYFGL